MGPRLTLKNGALCCGSLAGKIGANAEPMTKFKPIAGLPADIAEVACGENFALALGSDGSSSGISLFDYYF